MPDENKKYSFNFNSIFVLIGLIAFIFTAGINYGGVSSLKDDIDDIKSDYARKDILDIGLLNIENILDIRLLNIENELKEINITLKAKQ